jgi:hypothetical protein
MDDSAPCRIPDVGTEAIFHAEHDYIYSCSEECSQYEYSLVRNKSLVQNKSLDGSSKGSGNKKYFKSRRYWRDLINSV